MGRRSRILILISVMITTCAFSAAYGADAEKSPPAPPTAKSSVIAPTASSALVYPPTMPAPRLSVARDAPLSSLPYWRTKPDLRRKMRDERAVYVSVHNDDIKGPAGEKLIRFTMAGAGIVSREKEAAFRIAQQYEKLTDVSDHFKEVKSDPVAKTVFVIATGLGYQARMLLSMTPVSEDWRSELQWEVIWGAFKGMKGVIGYEKLDSTHTEVSAQTIYEAETLPLPKILMGFALEVITQKVAEKMRTYLEAAPDPKASAK